MRPPLSPTSGQRLYLREDELDAGLNMIFEASYALKACTRAAREAFALNWTQARALSSLLNAPIGVAGLARRLDVTKQAAIKTVEELQARAFVSRDLDTKDRRKRLIVLSPEGEHIARSISAAMRMVLAKAYRQAGGEAVAGCDAVLLNLKSVRANYE